MPRKVDKEGTEKRRQQILKAAGDCFSEKGFHQSSMADICKRAKLSPGTVYHYFGSKDEMILHFAGQELEEAHQYAEALKRVSSLEELVDMTIAAILDSDEFEEMQLYLEVLTEGGRNLKVGKVLWEAEQVFYKALKKHLKRLNAKGSGASAKMLASYVGMQVGALEIFKLEKPSAKECQEMARLSRKGLLHVLADPD